MPKSAKGADKAKKGISNLSPKGESVKGGFFGALLKKIKKTAQ